MVKTQPLLSALRDRLAAAGIENAPREAALILSCCTGIPTGRLALDREHALSREASEKALEMTERRSRREPLQYILGEWDFLGRRLLVRPGVLIPRPETELLAEYALSCIQGRQARVLDLCCGSGCLSVALAALGDAQVTAGDISLEALALTVQNAVLWEVTDRVEAAVMDARSRFPGRAEYDLLVGNPPYIPTGELLSLQPEVRNFEPALALDGGEDGLYFYRKIIENYTHALKPGGVIAFETGMGQAEAVTKLLRSAGFSDTAVFSDYAGIGRITAARRG